MRTNNVAASLRTVLGRGQACKQHHQAHYNARYTARRSFLRDRVRVSPSCDAWCNLPFASTWASEGGESKAKDKILASAKPSHHLGVLRPCRFALPASGGVLLILPGWVRGKWGARGVCGGGGVRVCELTSTTQFSASENRSELAQTPASQLGSEPVLLFSMFCLFFLFGFLFLTFIPK